MIQPGLRSRVLPLLGLLFLASPRPAQEERTGPGPVPVDVFHPDVRAGRPVPAPAFGGRIIVHLPNMPTGMNKVTDNSAAITWLQYAVCDTLLGLDWEYWTYEPRLAERYEVEDTVILKPEAAAKYGAVAREVGVGEARRAILFGAVTEAEGGWSVSAASEANPLEAPVSVPAEDVRSVERGTVYTFHLRAGVKWHDGHVFDADDVLFSWQVYNNPFVDCDSVRSHYQKIIDGEVLDPLTVRFFVNEQHFKTIDTVALLPILPRHLYDIFDPDNRVAHPEFHEELRRVHGDDYRPTAEDQAAFINQNPHNHEKWVGTGPYHITAWNQQWIEAERFDDYWDADDPDHAGHFDAIRWRYIPDDKAAMQAVLEGELDLFARVPSDDYFGGATATDVFQRDYYKGIYYTGQWVYVGWNMLRPQFRDQKVRQALAHAFDFDTYLKTEYHGIAKQVTGPQNYFGLGYDHSVQPFPFDLERAEEMLTEAGWYDRDGDGIIDKDGVPFEFEYLWVTGVEASRSFGLEYQESLASLGIRMNMRNLEWATFNERVLERNFDAMHLAWSTPLESDPEQIWHSKNGRPDKRSSNHYALMDPVVDELIERGQHELDVTKRSEIWHELHARLYDLQPCLFTFNSPRKFALNKKIRGMQTFLIAPGYSLRRLYYPVGTPGTRPTRSPRR